MQFFETIYDSDSDLAGGFHAEFLFLFVQKFDKWMARTLHHDEWMEHVLLLGGLLFAVGGFFRIYIRSVFRFWFQNGELAST